MRNIFGTVDPQKDFDNVVSTLDGNWLRQPRKMSIFDTPTLHNDIVSAILHAKVYHSGDLANGLCKNLSLVATKWDLDDTQVQSLFTRLKDEANA